MSPETCPRFDRCSAPVCPLDTDWRKRVHLEGERVCFWLTEASKRDGRLPESPGLSKELAKAVAEAYPAIVSRHGPIRRQLKRSAEKPSRLGRRPGKAEV